MRASEDTPFLFLFSGDRVIFCNLENLGTHIVAQADLKLLKTFLPLPPKCWVTDTHHNQLDDGLSKIQKDEFFKSANTQHYSLSNEF